MEKTITIDGKEVTFKSTGALPKRYRAQFGRDFFKDIMAMTKNKKLDMNKIDIETFYDIFWCMAKTHDPSIGDPITWLDNFDTFPIMDILPELEELIYAPLVTKKK